MKKGTVIFSLIMAGVLLTGCTGGTPSEIPEQAPTAESVTEEQSAVTAEQSAITQESESTEQGTPPEETAQSVPPEETADDELSFPLCAPNGDRIKPSEITEIRSRIEEPLTPKQLTADNWYTINCEGFAYMAEPAIHYNSIENPELYDGETWQFDGVPRLKKHDYKRYNTGDTRDGLTLTYAVTTFISENAEMKYDLGDGNELYGYELGLDDIYFAGCMAEFDGSIELTGWLALAPEDEGYTSRHDLIFVPDNASCILPSMLFSFSAEEGVVTVYYGRRYAGIGCVNDYPAFSLGNADSEELADIDLSRVPYADEGYANVRITLTDISMKSTIDWVSAINARVTGLEVIG